MLEDIQGLTPLEAEGSCSMTMNTHSHSSWTDKGVTSLLNTTDFRQCHSQLGLVYRFLWIYGF
jgi:hypothetical protein